MSLEMFVPCARTEAGLEKFGFDPGVFPAATVEALRGNMRCGGVTLGFGQREDLDPELCAMLEQAMEGSFQSCFVLAGPSGAWSELAERGLEGFELAYDVATAFRGAVISEDGERLFSPKPDESQEVALSSIRAAFWASANRYENVLDRETWISRAVHGERQAIDVIGTWANWCRPIGPEGKQRAYNVEFGQALLRGCGQVDRLPALVALVFESLHYLPLLEDATALSMIRRKTDAGMFDDSIERMRAAHQRDLAARKAFEEAKKSGDHL
jgi:hypothetical protein